MSRKPLSQFLTSNKDLPILNKIFIEDNALYYHDLVFKTNKNKQVEYIGAKAREIARQNKMNEFQRIIKSLKNEEESLLSKNDFWRQQKSVIEKTPENNTHKLENKKDLLEKYIMDFEGTLKNYKDSLNEISIENPTHEVFKEYSYDELSDLYHDYDKKTTNRKASEKLLNEYNSFLLQYINDKEQLEESQERQKKEIAEKLSLKEKLKQEIFELQQNDLYNRLESEKQQIENELKNIEDRIKKLNKVEGGIDSQLQQEKIQKEKTQDLLAHQTDVYKDIENKVLDLLNNKLDKFEVEKEHKVNNQALYETLSDFNLEEKPQRYEYEKLPPDDYTNSLKVLLKNLEYPIIRNVENNISEDCSTYMDNLKKELDKRTTLTENLFKGTESNLKTSIFPIIERTHDNVISNLANLKKYMEENKSSMLRLFVEYELEEKHHNTPEIIKTIEGQDSIIHAVNEKVCRYINKTQEEIDNETIEMLILEELEPSSWYDVRFEYINNGTEKKPLTTEDVSSFSTGERVRTYYTPLLALVDIIKSQMTPNAPFILMMDEAFATLDDTQTKFLLNCINKISDLFIVTVPSGGLPMAKNTTRIDTIILCKQELPNGGVITYSTKERIYEEFING